ncbi:hypothetical protein EDB89DRAFT_643349 [Lactarius sanguifluus]|nr:hypothetical protein EDB89DRAFT_643349 [Lactarius sanguifluus]
MVTPSIRRPPLTSNHRLTVRLTLWEGSLLLFDLALVPIWPLLNTFGSLWRFSHPSSSTRRLCSSTPSDPSCPSSPMAHSIRRLLLTSNRRLTVWLTLWEGSLAPPAPPLRLGDPSCPSLPMAHSIRRLPLTSNRRLTVWLTLWEGSLFFPFH